MTNTLEPSVSVAAGAARRLFGRRGAELADLAQRLGELSPSDLLSLLTLVSADRAASVRARSALPGSRFHRPSPVDPRLLHRLEGMIMASEPDLEFLELSPLQPFGINHALAGVSQKNVVGALRGSEVSADATTALFSEAVRRLDGLVGSLSSAGEVRLATHSRSTRSQKFPENSPLLPHFKVWAQVSVGRHGPRYGHDELVALLRHLRSELRVLDTVIPEVQLKISVSNVLLSRQLAAAGVIEVPNYPAEGQADPRLAQVPAEVSLDREGTSEWLQDNGFRAGAKITEKFRDLVREQAPELTDRLVLDLHRPYGVGYYKHLCYKIAAFTPETGACPWSTVAARSGPTRCSGTAEPTASPAVWAPNCCAGTCCERLRPRAFAPGPDR